MDKWDLSWDIYCPKGDLIHPNIIILNFRSYIWTFYSPLWQQVRDREEIILAMDKYLCINHQIEIKLFISFWNQQKCLGYFFPLHLKTYVVELRPLYIFNSFSAGSVLNHKKTSEVKGHEICPTCHIIRLDMGYVFFKISRLYKIEKFSTWEFIIIFTWKICCVLNNNIFIFNTFLLPASSDRQCYTCAQSCGSSHSGSPCSHCCSNNQRHALPAVKSKITNE